MSKKSKSLPGRSASAVSYDEAAQFSSASIPFGQPYQQPWPVPPAPPSTYRIAAAHVTTSSDAAIADVSYQLHDPQNGVQVFTGQGTSKREREDAPDKVTGELLASARAYEELTRRLFRAARSRIHAQDAERKAQATRRTKEEWDRLQEQAQEMAQKFSDNVTAAFNYMENVYAKPLSQGLWQVPAHEYAVQPTTIGGGGSGTNRDQASGGSVGGAGSVGHVVYTGTVGADGSSAKAADLPRLAADSLGGLRIELSAGRYLTLEDGFVVLHNGDDTPVRLTVA